MCPGPRFGHEKGLCHTSMSGVMRWSLISGTIWVDTNLVSTLIRSCLSFRQLSPSELAALAKCLNWLFNPRNSFDLIRDLWSWQRLKDFMADILLVKEQTDILAGNKSDINCNWRRRKPCHSWIIWLIFFPHWKLEIAQQSQLKVNQRSSEFRCRWIRAKFVDRLCRWLKFLVTSEVPRNRTFHPSGVGAIFPVFR